MAKKVIHTELFPDLNSDIFVQSGEAFTVKGNTHTTHTHTHTHTHTTHHTHTHANTILKINLYENCKIRVTRFQHNHAKESFMLCAQLYCSAHDFDCESQMKTICMTAGSKIYHTALFILRFTLYRQCLVEVVVS